jgi:hypothetical protein
LSSPLTCREPRINIGKRTQRLAKRRPAFSAIAVLPRKSARFIHFLDRPTCLLLGLEARFGELAGTIPGTPLTARHNRVLIKFGANTMSGRELDPANDIRG